MKKLTPLKRLILANVIMAVVLLSVGMYQWNEWRSLSVIKNKLELVDGSTGIWEELTEKNMEMQVRLDNYDSEKNVFLGSHERIGALHELSKQVGLEHIRMVKPDNITESKEIILEKFHLELDGEYNRIMRFINRIETRLARAYIQSVRFNVRRKNPLRCELKVVFLKPAIVS